MPCRPHPALRATFPQGKVITEVIMDYLSNPKLKGRAQSLRRNATPEENTLWYQYLRQHPVQFRRQKPIGPYIVDFYCHRARLVIELDGSQHFEDAGLEYDAERAAYLEGLGLLVIRIPNNEIKRNLRGVCEYVDQILASRT